MSEPVPAQHHVGQATSVEQSRAAAEVLAAVQVAQQCPRNIQTAVRAMRESCAQPYLAERAFFRFPRGGQQVSGESVHLARELARCWGNVQYGITELSRDMERGESEILVFAWDVQTNTRSTQTVVVPHLRDKRGGPERLTDLRDIYENNTNNGARRLRQAIFSILPPWFIEEARDLCAKTLADGGGVPLARRIADAVRAYEGIGIITARLEAKVGRPSSQWTDYDVAQLGIVFKSVQRGEARAEDEFPEPRVTAEEIAAQGAIPAAEPAIP